MRINPVKKVEQIVPKREDSDLIIACPSNSKEQTTEIISHLT